MLFGGSGGASNYEVQWNGIPEQNQ